MTIHFHVNGRFLKLGARSNWSTVVPMRRLIELRNFRILCVVYVPRPSLSRSLNTGKEQKGSAEPKPPAISSPLAKAIRFPSRVSKHELTKLMYTTEAARE